MTNSQTRMLTYINQAMNTAINILLNDGWSEQEVYAKLERAMDVYLELDALVRDDGSGSWGPDSWTANRCWEWSVPGEVMSNWIANGGPVLPFNNSPTLFDMLPWETIDCPEYFAKVADLENQLATELREVNINGWAEVMDAAADEARNRLPDTSGPFQIPLILILIGLFAWNRG